MDMAVVVIIAFVAVMLRDWTLQKQARAFRQSLWDYEEAKEAENKIVYTVAIRRSVGDQYFDISFNIKEKDSTEKTLGRVEDGYHLSGTCFEAVKKDMEDAVAKKREQLKQSDKIKNVRSG